AYEVGARTHNITIDFKAALNSGNLIANTSDLSFTIDATAFGASSMGSNLYKGDKIIVKENYDGTEYIAQGTVNSLNTSTGAVTVTSWDAGSTVPSVGFSVNATVFKWQREYFDLRGSLSTHRDAITNLTLRVTDGSQGANVWLDDFKSSGGYLTTPAGSTVTSSTSNRYAQYRIIQTAWDAAVSSAVSSATLNYESTLAPPLIGTPTALSATSIRWNFTDNANDETGFKVFDTSNVLKATCATANLTYCDETGLPSTPNTQITRKVAVYNVGDTGTYSDTASAYTFAVAPGTPTVNTRTATTINVIPSAGSNPAGTELAIYAEEGTTCDGSGGLGYIQNGTTTTTISTNAVWNTAAAWNAISTGKITVTGLNQEKIYSFCVKARNGNNVETGFGSAYSNNGGYMPISGGTIINSSSGCTTRYVDGNAPTRYICGVDSGSSGTNTAEMALQSGTFTLLSTETLVAGKLTLSGGSLIIPNGAVIKPGSALYVLDADVDGYPDNANMYYGSAPPTNYRRKNLQTTLTTIDCNPANGSQTTVCCTANGGACANDSDCCAANPYCGTDADGDALNTIASSGTCSSNNYPHTDTNDSQYCPDGYNPVATCNKCVNGAITNQISAEDLFSECSTTSNFLLNNSASNLSCDQKCSQSSCSNGNCNGSGACQSGGCPCKSVGTSSGTGGGYLYGGFYDGACQPCCGGAGGATCGSVMTAVGDGACNPAAQYTQCTCGN
ncbi:hypothetical protein KJ618_00195, partial [Patescibacteria group bacterium]|nr:hypothetical protein [Patescibacteria group bacterium]